MANTKGWVSWSYDSMGKDVSEYLLNEINHLLKSKGLFVDYDYDEENTDWDFKLNLEIEERKQV